MRSHGSQPARGFAISLKDGLEKGLWVAMGGTLPPDRIERAFALRHELEGSGTTAEAMVLEMKPGLYHDYTRRRESGKPFDVVTGVVRSWFLTLRVEPESAPQFEVERHEFISLNDDTWVGAVVPVIFDPDDHSRIVLDERYEALAAAARTNEPNLPKDLPTWRIRQEWTLAHGQEMNERLGALADAAASTSPISPGGGQTPAATTSAPADPAADLEKLAALHDGGALTDEQFAAARTQILDQI
jgi:hypothetical protein